MGLGSSPVAVASNSYIKHVSGKGFYDIQAIIECVLFLKCLRDMIKAYRQMELTDKYS